VRDHAEAPLFSSCEGTSKSRVWASACILFAVGRPGGRGSQCLGHSWPACCSRRRRRGLNAAITSSSAANRWMMRALPISRMPSDAKALRGIPRHCYRCLDTRRAPGRAVNGNRRRLLWPRLRHRPQWKRNGDTWLALLFLAVRNFLARCVTLLVRIPSIVRGPSTTRPASLSASLH
jgi:hypothetical protein